MSYAIAGLQRTGTNYLERVIADNFGRDDLEDPFWKHSLPSEVPASILSSATVILVTRHPVIWFQSCVSHTAIDVIETRSKYFAGRSQAEGYAALYCDFYRRWLEYFEQSRGICARYEDVLGGDLTVLAPLSARAGRAVQECQLDFPKVRFSIELSGDDLERHRRLECHVSKAVVLEFWKALDRHLVDRLGYSLEDVTFTEEVGTRSLAYRLLQRPWSLSDAELDQLIAASAHSFVANCQVLHALGRQIAQRRGDLRMALDLFGAALLASEREREIYGDYSGLPTLGVIEDIIEICPKISKLDSGAKYDHLAAACQEKYKNIHARMVELFRSAILKEAEANAAHVVRSKTLVELGHLLMRVDRLEEAESAVADAIAFNPSHVVAHALLGEIRQRQGRLEDAEKSLREAIHISPEDANLRANLSNVLRRQDKIEAALAEAAAAIGSDAPEPRWLHQHACLALQAGRLEEASQSLHAALRSEPDNCDHFLVLVEVRQRQGRLEEATNSLRQAIRCAPHDMHGRVKLSDMLERQGQIAEALRESALAIDYGAVEPSWFHRHGWLALQVGRLDEARESLLTALRFEPDHRDRLLLLAEVQERQGRLDEAADSLRRAVRAAPQDGRLRFLLGGVLGRQGRRTEALEETAAAIRSDAAEPGWFYLHACLALEAGRLEEAAESVDTALRSEPDNRDVLLVLTKVRQRQGRLEEATASLRRAVELAPLDGHLHFLLSDALRRQDLIAEALDEAAVAIRSDAAQPWWYHHHACLALSVGKLEEASESLRAALRSEPDRRDHLFVLAEVQRRQGRLEEAANSLRHAIRFAPHDGHLHFMLSDLLGRQGRIKDALIEATEAIECPGREPWWFHHHARLASRLGKLELAEGSLRRALESEPDNPRHLLALARVLLRSGRLGGARNAALRAFRLELGRRFPWTKSPGSVFSRGSIGRRRDSAC